MDEVTEIMCHGTLEGGSRFLQTKGHYSICECAPQGCKCSLVMIFFLDLNLVVFEKIAHEGEDLMFGRRIDEGCWEVVFGTHPIQIVEVCANVNGTLFFFHENMI